MLPTCHLHVTYRIGVSMLPHARLYPLLAEAFPVLADGSTNLDPDSGASRMRVHDAFIVRYDIERDGSLSLPEHCDTSSMSFTVALNSSSQGNFEGGGTWFEALGEEGQVVDADVGRAVAFAGPLRHAGYPIKRGTRVILVLFLYVEGFPYHQYIKEYCAENCCDGQGVAVQEERGEEGGKTRQGGETRQGGSWDAGVSGSSEAACGDAEEV